MLTREQLFEALDDALALAHEFDGAGLEAKLAAFGLDMEDVADALKDRWEDNVSGREGGQAFVSGFTEGLITGVMLLRHMEDDRGD